MNVFYCVAEQAMADERRERRFRHAGMFERRDIMTGDYGTPRIKAADRMGIQMIRDVVDVGAQPSYSRRISGVSNGINHRGAHCAAGQSARQACHGRMHIRDKEVRMVTIQAARPHGRHTD